MGAATVVDAAWVRSVLSARTAVSHKGDYGRALLLCGSQGYLGAALLAARACLRSGAGLVSLGVSRPVYPLIAAATAAAAPEAMVFAYENAEDPVIVSQSAVCTACLIGPGLGRSVQSKALVHKMLSSSLPLVVDADGLGAGTVREGASGRVWRRPSGAVTVLTPHEGEFARIGGDLSAGRRAGAVGFALRHGVVLVLKGHNTLVVSPEGLVCLIPTGNPGMAKGGSGDALAGLLAGLLARLGTAFPAAVAAAWLHGRAGDLCAAEMGMEGMTPGDLISALPGAFREVCV